MKLTIKMRKSLDASQFAGPDRSYPVNDKSHAVAAESRATQAVNAGRMSEGEADAIKAKARKVLHKKV